MIRENCIASAYAFRRRGTRDLVVAPRLSLQAHDVGTDVLVLAPHGHGVSKSISTSSPVIRPPNGSRAAGRRMRSAQFAPHVRGNSALDVGSKTYGMVHGCTWYLPASHMSLGTRELRHAVRLHYPCIDESLDRVHPIWWQHMPLGPAHQPHH